jgi:hypothetical protein
MPLRIVLFCVLLSLVGVSSAAIAPYNIGPWRLGMSREEVTSFAENGPYEKVAVTGGYETRNAAIAENKTAVSFVFRNDKLDFIQVWRYEGKSFEEAKNAILKLFDEMTGQFGGATIPHIDVKGPHGFDHRAMKAVLERTLGTAPDLSEKWEKENGTVGTFMFDLVPQSQPEGSRLQGQFGYSGRYHTYYVFLFQDRADAPERSVKANVSLERL